MNRRERQQSVGQLLYLITRYFFLHDSGSISKVRFARNGYRAAYMYMKYGILKLHRIL